VRAAHPAARTLLTVALACGVAVSTAGAASADDDDLDVSTAGVSFHDRDRDRDDDRVGYSIRSLEGWRYSWLTETMPQGRSGYVSFSAAAADMPEGYCVVYVRVPGVGEWGDDDGVCTPASAPATSPSPTPSSAPSPTPSATASKAPSTDKDEKRRKKASPSPSPEVQEDATPTPTPSSSPSPSPSASASPSPSRSASASASPSPSASTVPVADPPAVDAGPVVALGARDDSPHGLLLDGDLWAGAGLALAATGVAAGGLVAWRSRRRTP
jgi:hypothetical protein